jgi:Ubiquitin family
LLTDVVNAGKPLSSVSVSLLGTTYAIKDVSTVDDVQQKLKDVSGTDIDDKHVSIMFDGKVLDSSTVLSDVGVDEDSTLVVMPSGFPSKEEMEQYLESAGLSKDKLNEMIKSFGGSGEGGMPSIEESIKAMSDVMNSPMLQEMLSDPEKLEQSRQMILSNPMLKGMMGSMPGMEDLLNDEVAWRQAMQAAAEMYKNMDPTVLMNSMLGGAMNRATANNNNADGNFLHLDMLGNTDDSASSTSAKKALEELDEDD